MSRELKYHELIAILKEARDLLAQPENDFVWSSWEDAPAALHEIDGLISRLESGILPPRSDLEFLFLPTGPIQEVSLSSGWAEKFLELANRFDTAVEKVYNVSLFSRLSEMLKGKSANRQ